MKPNRPARATAPAAWLVAALLAGAAGAAGTAAPVLAQPDDAAAVTPFAPSAALDSMLVLVELRPAEAVRHDLREAESQREEAHLRLDRGKELQQRSEGLIELKKSEIGVLDARLALAKSEKDKALEEELKRQKKVAELQKKLLEKREELRKKELELARAEIEYASASRDALERELELAGLREERAGLAGTEPGPETAARVARLDRELRELQDRTLEKRVQAYERLKKVAEQEISVNKARRNVLEAQAKLIEEAARPE